MSPLTTTMTSHGSATPESDDVRDMPLIGKIGFAAIFTIGVFSNLNAFPHPTWMWIGGLGGCPFAPNASGNVPIEDLAHALGAMGVDTGVSVESLVAAADIACGAVGREVASHVGIVGPRFA